VDASRWSVLAVGSEDVETSLALVDGGAMVPLDDSDDVVDASADTPEDEEDELDVAPAPAALFEVLCAHADGEVTTTEAHELATAHGGDVLDVSRRSVGNYLSALVDAGVLTVDQSGRSNRYQLLTD
jgi:DNA-binding transcriptional ArsR family regulator